MKGKIFSKTLGARYRGGRECHCAYCGKYVKPADREYGYEVNCKDCEKRVQR